MIVSIDVDAQKTFTPLCPKELPVAEGHLIADELNAQAALADLRVMTKDAHHAAAKWLVDNPVETDGFAGCGFDLGGACDGWNIWL